MKCIRYGRTFMIDCVAKVPVLESWEAPQYNCEAPCLMSNGGLGAEPPAGPGAEPLVSGLWRHSPLKLRAFSTGMSNESSKICRINSICL